MILDAVTHVWCPLCGRKPGRACDAEAAPLHVDYDGTNTVHLQRIDRADCLADGSRRWRADELRAFVEPLAANGAIVREGRA